MPQGGTINKSLLTLGTVMRSLSEQSAAGDKVSMQNPGPRDSLPGSAACSCHWSAVQAAAGRIAYRDSKLTRVLQPSLAGTGRTAVICCINPAAGAHMHCTVCALNACSTSNGCCMLCRCGPHIFSCCPELLWCPRRACRGSAERAALCRHRKACGAGASREFGPAPAAADTPAEG